MEIKTIVLGETFHCYCEEEGAEFELDIDINTVKVINMVASDLTVGNLLEAVKKSRKLLIKHLIDTQDSGFFG